MRGVLLSLIMLGCGVYVAGTLGLLPMPLHQYFENDQQREDRLEREQRAASDSD